MGNIPHPTLLRSIAILPEVGQLAPPPDSPIQVVMSNWNLVMHSEANLKPKGAFFVRFSYKETFSPVLSALLWFPSTFLIHSSPIFGEIIFIKLDDNISTIFSLNRQRTNLKMLWWPNVEILFYMIYRRKFLLIRKEALLCRPYNTNVQTGAKLYTPY